MPVDPRIPPFKGSPQTGIVTPLPASEPAATGTPPSLVAASPPPLPLQPARKSGGLRQVLAILLSLCLGLFLADAVVSLLDDSLILCFDVHVLTTIRGFLFLFAMIMAVVTYGLLGLTPMIPKRLFLPLTLFTPAAGLLAIPTSIYFYGRIQQIALGISCCQVILGLSILYRAQGGWQLRWPLMAESLHERRFSWRNLFVFLLVNVFVLVPGVIVYLIYCTVLAADHFSDGFVALRSDGLVVQARSYVRNDGKTIQLFPMSHVGETDFYQKLSESFPTNSIILMEGVTDDRNLLTNKISYKRMAASLGVAEQQKEFRPRGELVRADVDVEQFATSTIDFLNAIMLVHSKGLNAQTMLALIQYTPPPHFEEHLVEDLLRKRNRRLLEEIKARLSQSEHITVPWGAAHMPEIAREIQKSGFRLVETREYVTIRFRSAANNNQTPGKGGASEQPN